MNGTTVSAGTLHAKIIPARMAPLSWRLRNALRITFIYGMVVNTLAKAFSKITGIPTITARLLARKRSADGTIENYGVLSNRVVTSAFVNFVVDQLQTETSVFGDFKYHDSGVGVTAENIANTAIETTDGESRATGTQAEGASTNIYKSVGTIAYTTTKAITEHGVFNDPTAGTLMDRSVFAAINVASGDSIEFTYEITFSSGG